MASRLFVCGVCRLHYASKELADKCYAWCSAHGSCNLQITKHSVERGGK